MPEANISMEKRANPRLSVKIPVKFHLVKDKGEIKNIEEWRSTEKNAFTLDLSLGGMLIAVDQPLTVGSILKFQLFLFDRTNSVAVYAEVLRADEFGAALHFLMMTNEEREFLQSYLDKSSR